MILDFYKTAPYRRSGGSHPYAVDLFADWHLDEAHGHFVATVAGYTEDAAMNSADELIAAYRASPPITVLAPAQSLPPGPPPRREALAIRAQHRPSHPTPGQ